MLYPGYMVNQGNTCISPIPECRKGKKNSRRTRVWKTATSEKCLLSKNEDPSPNPQEHTQKTKRRVMGKDTQSWLLILKRMCIIIP